MQGPDKSPGAGQNRAEKAPAALARAEISSHVRATGEGGLIVLSVPGIRCGGCVASIERALGNCPGVTAARANSTLKRVSVTLETAETDPSPVMLALERLGFPATPIDLAPADEGKEDRTGARLIRAIAVSGFGAMNIMLLSVAVWSGAEGATRDTFHLISALIATPVILFAGRPFFTSAIAALRRGRLNMDAPISLAVLLALALSLFETVKGSEHVFFDAATTLLFFLLIGRYLDQLMRDRARSAVSGLARLAPKGAMLRAADGSLVYTLLENITSGMVIHVAPGERAPVDIRILSGSTDIDRSLVTGEAMPVSAGAGDDIEAGALNLTGGFDAEVLRAADQSFLAEMTRMLTAAESGRSAYVRIADRAARLYAPVVHLLALITFIGWMVATGDWQTSLFIAISVLIITCPCALGLAVPVAHVVAAGRLMREGVMMKDGSALERLAEIDQAVFDKTGTLTTGIPVISGGPDTASERAAAHALAARSRHPAARAITLALSGEAAAEEVQELPGLGVEGIVNGRRARLGRPSWVSEIAAQPVKSGPAFAFEGEAASGFELAETLRPGAKRAIDALISAGLPVSLLSGDETARAKRIGADLGIDEVWSGASPADKIALLERLRDQGGHGLMVGDGLNDTAALAAAHVSMAPASAPEAGRAAADFVFLRDDLGAVPFTLDIAYRTARIVKQNFGLAIAYNCIAIPLAMAGYVTPLIAALAMSGSSLLVIGNALRINRRAKAPKGAVFAPIGKEAAA